MNKMLPVLIMLAIAVLAFREYQNYERGHLVSSSTPSPTENNSRFRCDGRIYCSEMTSCAEAMFFLNHCPNIKMDGDEDGVPCERQWCNRFDGR